MATTTTRWATLESGDRLTREEFHRRYEKRPDIKKAELVEGVVYVGSRVTAAHGGAHAAMVGWLGIYGVQHPELQLYDRITVLLDARNEVQPDACLCREEPGGPRMSEEGYIEGSPQLVVEIAVSSVSYDLHDKLHAYRRNRVPEYVVWRVHDRAIDWFRLRGEEYERIEPDDRGVIESTTFPGLRLHLAKMLAGDLVGVRAELESQ
jgi:Uma2 family endonuclease